MDYQQATGYLQSLGKFGSNLGLARVCRLLAELGRPQDRLRIVHIAGTNGKGSTAAMTAAIAAAAGYRVGLYTSPHLSSYTERFRINGNAISPEEFARLLTTIRPVVARVAAEPGLGHPTEFEVLTACAFHLFAGMNLDLAVVEVGLGGRLDATNVVEPEVAVITHIALEHTGVLGDTLEAIAREKAGIIKPYVPVISTPQDPEAEAVIIATCRQQHASLTLVGRDILPGQVRLQPGGICCDLRGEGWEYRDLEIALLGEHQVENAAAAVGAVRALGGRGFSIDEKAVRRGLSQVCWPGRMEVLPGEPTFLLDVAHNPDGTRVLARAVHSHFPARRVIMVFGALADKDVAAMATHLAPLAELIIITRPQSQRALEPAVAAGFFRALNKAVLVEEEIPAAVELAREKARAQDLVLVCGSFYMVGRAREYLLCRRI